MIYETTLPVGTTEDRWKPALEKGSGLAEGTDFHVVFSPERVLTGRVFADLRKYPKLVGGLSDRRGQGGAATSTRQSSTSTSGPTSSAATACGTSALPKPPRWPSSPRPPTATSTSAWPTSSPCFAEKAGIDVYQVIEASNSQPYSHIHRPGISVGGHCIPVYPRLYLSNDPDATVVSAAREANAAMPRHAVDLLRARRTATSTASASSSSAPPTGAA